MPSTKGIRSLVIIVPPRRKSNLTLFFISLFIFMTSCSKEELIIGATWEGESDFMFVTGDKMQMNYASYIPGKLAYIGSFYEVMKLGSNELIDKMEVVEIEFKSRVDGKNYCRIWGKVDRSDEMSYLLAYECIPVYQR